MQGRSWMAALIVASAVLPTRGLAGDRPTTVPSSNTTTPAPKPESPEGSPKKRVVRLELAIAGLGKNGCDVEVKPGNAGCQFETRVEHVDLKGYATLVIKDVELRSADRDCTVAITIKEPGQADRTVRRGVRLGDESTKPEGQKLMCFLSSPSRISRTIDVDKIKR